MPFMMRVHELPKYSSAYCMCKVDGSFFGLPTSPRIQSEILSKSKLGLAALSYFLIILGAYVQEELEVSYRWTSSV